MAYLAHKDAGTSLTRTEDNATDRHYMSGGAANDFLVYDTATASFINKTAAQVLALLSAQAGAAFSFNSQNLTSVGTLNTHTIPAGTDTFAMLAATQELSAKTLNASVAKGIWTASGTWTIPAVTLGGTLTVGGNTIINAGHITLVANSYVRSVAEDASIVIAGGTDANGAAIALYGKSHTTVPGKILVYTPNAALSVTQRLSITGAVNTAVATWSATTQVGLVLGGNMTVTGYAFDAGAGSAQINTTGAGTGLIVQSTQDGDNGARLWGKHITASVAVNDEPFRLLVEGRNAAGGVEYYGELHYKITDITAGAEACGMTFTVFSAGAQNDGMTLSGAGVLAVDLGGSGAAAQVDLFDEYDDALVLRQGIQQNNRELLANMGVLERKDTGSGYMMKLQPMVRLLAGGIYQTRQMLEDKVAQLEARLKSFGGGSWLK